MYPPNPSYPVRLDIEYPDHLSRLLIFVKWLLAIPHFIALFFLGIGAYVVADHLVVRGDHHGRIPRGDVQLHGRRAALGGPRPGVRVPDDGRLPAVLARGRPRTTRSASRSTTRSRSPAGGRSITWLLVIPAAFAAWLILLAADVCVFLAWFAILITGRYPRGDVQRRADRPPLGAARRRRTSTGWKSRTRPSSGPKGRYPAAGQSGIRVVSDGRCAASSPRLRSAATRRSVRPLAEAVSRASRCRLTRAGHRRTAQRRSPKNPGRNRQTRRTFRSHLGFCRFF